MARHTASEELESATRPALLTSKGFGWLLIITGIIGLLGSFQLVLERLNVFRDANYTPSCDFGLFVSCKSVMTSSQAALFGFPNPLLGLIAFAIPITIGVALLGGSRFNRWFWLGFQVGITLGMIFVVWLWTQSLYAIGSLCPYCMIVWAATIPTFVYTTLFNVAEGNFSSKPPARQPAIVEWAGTIAIIFYLIFIAAIVLRFWDGWGEFFGQLFG